MIRKALALPLAVAFVGLVGGCGRSAVLSVNSSQMDQAIKGVYPALVRIDVVMTDSAGGRMQKAHGMGSGAIFSPDGYVITNHHVAGRGQRLVCRLSDRQDVDAVLVGTDPMTDIAVLKLKLDQRKDKSPLPVATFGDSAAVRVGDTVLAMGSPGGLSQSVTVGAVSNTEMISPYGSMKMEGESIGTLVRWIGHCAPIYPGNSGGPLVNLKGQIIGINEVGIAGLGGAIPANLAQSVAWQIVKNPTHKVIRSYTGLDCQPLLKNSPIGKGVLVSGVAPQSPAEAADFASGDVIQAVDGRPVSATVQEEMPLLHQLLLSKPVGTQLKFTVLRGDKTLELKLVTDAREPAIDQDLEVKAWGMTAMDFTRSLAIEMQRPNKDGVLVTTVREGGPCAAAKPAIREGDIIVQVGDAKVADLAALRKATEPLAQSPREAPTLVAFERGQQKLLTVVKLGKKPEDIKPKRARMAYLGVETQVLTRELAEALKLKPSTTGVRVTRVLENTTAATSGLKVGDVILAVDGSSIPTRNVEDQEVFTNIIRQRDTDAQVTLDLWRDGKIDKLPVKLEPSPTPASELKVYQDRDFELTVREMSDLDRANKKLGAAAQGVLVSAVEQAGWAAMAGLQVDDMIVSADGAKVANVDAFKAVLDQARKNKAKRLVLFVKRGVHTAFLQVEPMWQD